MEGSIKFANIWKEMFKMHAAKPVDWDKQMHILIVLQNIHKF